MKTNWTAFTAMVCLLTTVALAGDPPAELGAVNWGRNLDAAKQESARSGKPVLVLFQEVPG